MFAVYGGFWGFVGFCLVLQWVIDSNKAEGKKETQDETKED